MPRTLERTKASAILHAIITREPDGRLSLTSPQLPGFVAVYEDEPTFRREYKHDIQQAGFKSGQVMGHTQLRGETASGREYAIRWSDLEQETRKEAGQRAERVLHGPEGDTFLAEHEGDGMGVINIVCALPTDTVGWLVDQMDPRGDMIVAVVSVAEELAYMIDVAVGQNKEGWPSLEEMGWGWATTLADVMAGRTEPVRVTV